MTTRRTYLTAVAGAVAGLSGCLGGTRDCDIEGRAVSSSVAAGGSFPNVRADSRQTGYVSTRGTDSNGENWTVATGDLPPEGRGVVVADGNVFVAGDVLYALDQADGSVRWCRKPGTRTPTSPAVLGDRVVVATDHVADDAGGLQAFATSDGTREWRNGSVGEADEPPTAADGTVYVSGTRGNPVVSAVDGSSGALRWQSDVGSGDISAPAVSPAGAFVQTDGRLLRLARSDGSVDWTVATDGPTGPPVVADGTVYASRGPATVGAWDARSGTLRWEFDGFAAAARARYLCAAPERLVVASKTERGGELVALRRADGRELWRRDAAALAGSRSGSVDPSLGPPLATDDSVYAGLGAGLLAVSSHDGSTRWYRAFPNRVHEGDMALPGDPGPPALAGDAMFVLAGTGTVYALDH
ncbi:outer membrane protein assembly factor BamB family protein [Halosimplex halobium]|uniref:outer membrane protein assembly factor BamB family protein n=1 Tax=Halosimplex halobium TaxID=3396618 RepID=UPI003F54CF6E